MDLKQDADEELMREVKEDNAEAAKLLFLRYRSRIFGFFRQQTSDIILSEDLTQDVFERMIRYRNSYREGYCFQHWIFQIARNVRRDNLKSESKYIGGKTEVQELDKTPGEDPYEKIFLREENQKLHCAMQKLNTAELELIYLSKFEKMKYKDISKITGQTENSVKVAVHRALKQLKVHFFQQENKEI